MVDGSCRELPVKLFSPESLQVVNEELPELEDIVPGELGPPLHDDRPGPEELGLQGGPEAHGAGPHNQHSVPLAVEAVAAVELVPSLLLEYFENLFILVG